MQVNGRRYRARAPQNVIRDAEWVLLYRDGKTLAEIGKQYGVTREYVRQQLAKLGMAADCGGRTIRTFKQATTKANKRKAVAARREDRHVAKWGMSRAEMDAISPLARSHVQHPLYRFYYQRRTAKARGIEWRFIFGDWWRIWQESGKWDERGRGKGGYCMARWNDDGPYSVENCYITTNAENGRHYQDARRGGYRASSPKVATGVYRMFPNCNKPYVALLGGTKQGYFATVEEAISARAARGLKSPQTAVTPFGGSSPP